MSTDLLHTEKPVLIVTAVASGVVNPRRFVKFSGAQCSVKGEAAMGVSRDYAADGQPIEVTTQGTALVEAGEALGLGVEVTTSDAGKAVIAGKNNRVNGVTMRAQATSGQDVEIMLGGYKIATVTTTTTTTTTTTSSSTTTTTTAA